MRTKATRYLRRPLTAAGLAREWGRVALRAVADAPRFGDAGDVLERLAGQAAAFAFHWAARAPGPKTKPRPGSSAARHRSRANGQRFDAAVDAVVDALEKGGRQ